MTSLRVGSRRGCQHPQVPGTLADVLDARGDNEYLQAGGVFTGPRGSCKRENEIDSIRLPASSRVRFPTTSESPGAFIADNFYCRRIKPRSSLTWFALVSLPSMGAADIDRSPWDFSQSPRATANPFGGELVGDALGRSQPAGAYLQRRGCGSSPVGGSSLDG